MVHKKEKKRKRGRPTETQDLLGAGQANYVAANQMAVELCAARHGQNLPGLAVALGPVLGAGMLEHDPPVAKILKSVGLDFISVQEAAAALLAPTTLPYFMASRIRDVVSDENLDPGKGRRKLWDHLVVPSRANSAASDSLEDRVALARKRLAMMFSLDADEVDTDTPILNFGVDSLLGTELVNVFKRELGLDVTFTDILSGASIDSLFGA